MSSVRVCVIIPSFRPVVGGAELRTERVYGRLAEAGARVAVLTRRYPGLAPFETFGDLPVHRLGHESEGKLGAITFAAHTLWALGTRFREHSVVHVSGQDAPLAVGMIAKMLFRSKLVVTVRSDPKRFLESMGRLRRRLFPKMVDVIAALSPNMAAQLVAAGLPSERVLCLPGGVDTQVFRPPSQAERYEARKQLSLDRDTLVFLFVGRLQAVKDLETLLRAWHGSRTTLPRRLLVVGEGDEGVVLRQLATALGLDDVSFEGEAKDVVRYLHAADVFVLPSRSEGLSNALLEAMSTGLAAIVSDIPGNRAATHDEPSAIFFPSGDVAALANALVRMEVPSIRERSGRQGRVTVERHHSFESSIAAHRDFYLRAEERDFRSCGRVMEHG